MEKLVISLVGMIGCGKTTTIIELSKRGYPIIEEGYMSTKVRFDNKLLTSKWNWIANWFESVYDFFDTSIDYEFLFTDRSAIEAGLWNSNCSTLKKPLDISFSEMKSMGFNFITICLMCRDEILNERIEKRLLKEPYRERFNENNKKFINTLNESYKNHIGYWDYIIDTSDMSPKLVCDTVINILKNMKEMR